jgi:uncharacterized protein
MPRVVHFEIVTGDTERVRSFYEKVFEWKFNRWGTEDYWLISTGQQDERGIDGGFVKSKGEPVVVNTIDVPDLDEYIKRVQDNGGELEVPKRPIPGVGWLCYFKDVEGNLFGMMQADPSAK